MIKIYSKIRLTSSAYREKGVNEGSEGYIIEDFEDGNFDVEFSDSKGETKAILILTSTEFEVADS
ncbi:hypothetical protein C7Y70_20535 [Pseudoalteromonas sp. KS88]|uniref:DUF4926 domain-containing protein n=1 Tax=Pseudoalteromonas sp. KS88 TaxID=2109918 RepID=UPI0010821E0A|nr:DUF4926 domain-containing protein [Pseudoalteromonas sp. KS88]TGE75630.1 hypothetical protein C7Y70_20535 [Pseudoalteromonas sp. KS88]